jgi:Ni,Fe-hydrogenase maturation factor
MPAGVKKMKLILFGNPALDYDNVAIKVGEKLKKRGIDVLHVENPIELTDLAIEEYIILDVAEGITEPKIITDLDKLLLGRLCSLHDFDMAFFLKLLKELGQVSTVRIIALPQRMEVAEGVFAVEKLLTNFK